MATLDWEEADREIRDMFPKALCPNCDRIMTLPKLLEVLTTNNAVIACTGPKGCYAKIPASHLKPPPD